MNHKFALLILAALLPLSAHAENKQCAHSSPRNLALDLAGVKQVTFETGGHQLHLQGSNASPTIEGRACASDEKYLADLTVTQEKHGDTLTVRLGKNGNGSFNFNLGIISFSRYAWLDLRASVPANLPVSVNVGSGDAWVNNIAELNAQVGSGDLDARNIQGAVSANVGSGDIKLTDIGTLRSASVGSGDLVVNNVRGAATIGNIGSGDFKLDGAGGDVNIGSISSGDAGVRNITGNVNINSIGSGDADVRNVTGNVFLRSLGSGDLRANGVRGDLRVDSVGSGDVHHSNISGKISLPRNVSKADPSTLNDTRQAQSSQGGFNQDMADARKEIGNAITEIRQAKARLDTENLTLNSGVHFGSTDIHLNQHDKPRKSTRSDSQPKAEITPNGDLLIDGEAVAIDAQQRQQLLAYRKQTIDIAKAGLQVGERGAKLGADVANRSMLGLIFGALTGRLERQMQTAVQQDIAPGVRQICQSLPALMNSQQQLAASVPDFKPYATMTQGDIGDCNKSLADLDTDFAKN
jgi:hypothetical protein